MFKLAMTGITAFSITMAAAVGAEMAQAAGMLKLSNTLATVCVITCVVMAVVILVMAGIQIGKEEKP